MLPAGAHCHDFFNLGKLFRGSVLFKDGNDLADFFIGKADVFFLAPFGNSHQKRDHLDRKSVV